MTSSGPVVDGLAIAWDSHRMRHALLASAYLAAFAVIGWLAFDGWPYYRAPLAARPRMARHFELKPGGERGHALGVAGAAMMTAMLGYSLRKRVPALRRLGPLPVWLRAHIFLGVVGPALVVLHTALKVGGVVAISFWSMVAVAASGFLGRFLYVQLPRTAAGDELTLADAVALDEELAAELRDRFALTSEQLAALDTVAGAGLARRGLAALVVRLPFEPLLLRLRLARFRRSCRQVPRPLLARFASVARQKALLRRRLVLWESLRELFHYWHVVHKPFAVLMYLFLVVHVAVAWMTGYTGPAH